MEEEMRQGMMGADVQTSPSRTTTNNEVRNNRNKSSR
jgi:hypothetical protein